MVARQRRIRGLSVRQRRYVRLAEFAGSVWNGELFQHDSERLRTDGSAEGRYLRNSTCSFNSLTRRLGTR